MTELAPDPELLPQADEATVLQSFLDYYRSVFLRKVDGLSEEQVRVTIPPSDLSALGLVRHMAEVERGWFRRRTAGDAQPGDVAVSLHSVTLDHAIEQPRVACPGRFLAHAAQREQPRPLGRHPGQERRHDHGRQDPEEGLGEPDPRLCRGEGEIAGRREPEAASERVARDDGQGRTRGLGQRE